MRWWGGFDLIRRLMFIVAVTLVNFIQPDYAQVWCQSNTVCPFLLPILSCLVVVVIDDSQ